MSNTKFIFENQQLCKYLICSFRKRIMKALKIEDNLEHQQANVPLFHLL